MGSSSTTAAAGAQRNRHSTPPGSTSAPSSRRRWMPDGHTVYEADSTTGAISTPGTCCCARSFARSCDARSRTWQRGQVNVRPTLTGPSRAGDSTLATRGREYLRVALYRRSRFRENPPVTGRTVPGDKEAPDSWWECRLPGCEGKAAVQAAKAPTCPKHQQEMSPARDSK
jgi:hypothetical protein